jgi:hypothetical protein
MRSCMGAVRRGTTKKGPLGALSDVIGMREGLDAHTRHRAGGDQAEEQQEGRGQAVEMTFELQDKHDTHL